MDNLKSALWSLKEDAETAWKMALEYGDPPSTVLEALGRSIKNLERILIELDTNRDGR